MNTPIHDFVTQYANSNAARLHMPGHKGVCFTGCEKYDITEIEGADSLYQAGGIIQESEGNAAALFGTGATLYSTEGSSQCIRAMLYLAILSFLEKYPGHRPAILAARNVHKAFLTAAALLDFDIVWLFPENEEYSLCRCDITETQLESALRSAKNIAGVYITSPDYLGNCKDILRISKISHNAGIPLLVDNAHGAYSRFLSPSSHPIAQGADICCDSAHKTLPVLTGGAYLHISKTAPQAFQAKAKAAMAMFGSTSPSYLILQSLDLANQYLSGPYAEKLADTVSKIKAIQSRLFQKGWRFAGDEPLKLTFAAKKYGYSGHSLAKFLCQHGIICEYADPDYVVLMPTPETSADAFRRLEAALALLERRPELPEQCPRFQKPERRMSVRRALFSPCRLTPVTNAAGNILSSIAVSCPPAISPAVPGEELSENTISIYQYYGIRTVSVLSDFA